MKKLRAPGSVKDLVVRTKVDPKRKARFDALVKVLAREEKREATGWDAYWEAVGDILDAELWTAGGYESAEEFITTVTKTSPRHASRQVRVARLASPAEEARYGVAKLDAAVAYVEAKMGGAPNGKLRIDWATLRIPVGAKNVRLEDATVPQVNAATRALRGGRDSGERRAPAEHALAQAIGKVGSLKGVTVRVANGLVSLGHVPLAALGHLAKVLARYEAP